VRRCVWRKSETSARVSGLAIQPRGLRENNCTVSQPTSFETTSALCTPPLMGAWKPMRGLVRGGMSDFSTLCFVIGKQQSFENYYLTFGIWDYVLVVAAVLNIKYQIIILKWLPVASNNINLFVFLCFHHPEHVSSEDLLNIALWITATEKLARQVR